VEGAAVVADHRALLTDLRQRVFTPAGGPGVPDRIGAEAELIPLLADTGAPVPLDAAEGPALLPLLRRHAMEAGWVEAPTPYGAPRFRVPEGGWLFFEPGGQIEFSTPPYSSASALLACLRRVLLPLIETMRGEGIALVAAGIDPFNPLERVPLQLGGARYTRMAAYLARFGPAGGRMMRQTAAFQLNLDFGSEPELRWRVLNAAAPFLLALFANSPCYAGRPTGHRSFRAACWRALDPARTGLLPCADDPAAGYLEFALAAPALLKCPPQGEDYLPFREWLARGQATPDDWHVHLSTLFPEVRPKGYLELRSLDAVAPEGWAASVAVVGGLLYDPQSLRAAADLLGAPDPAVLRGAGECGLADPRIAAVARDLLRLGLEGAAALGSGFIDESDLEAAQLFFDHFTGRGRSPADGAAHHDSAPTSSPISRSP
jgi:glutamate--cysteine ligase